MFRFCTFIPRKKHVSTDNLCFIPPSGRSLLAKGTSFWLTGFHISVHWCKKLCRFLIVLQLEKNPYRTRKMLVRDSQYVVFPPQGPFRSTLNTFGLAYETASEVVAKNCPAPNAKRSVRPEYLNIWNAQNVSERELLALSFPAFLWFLETNHCFC